MRSGSRVWLSGLLITFLCTLIPSGRLCAQQTPGAPASSEAIDQLTAPIALYPDALLFQMLTASMDVGALQSFADWMGKNATLKGSELQDAAQKAGFDAAYIALAPFPQVIQMDEAARPSVHEGQERHLRFDPATARAGAGSRQSEDDGSAAGRNADHLQRPAGDRHSVG
jgi:hypothetical protein